MAFALHLMLLIAVVGADYPICNVEKVAAGSPYSQGILNLLSQLQNGVDSNGDNYKLEHSIAGGGAIYGQAFCSSKFENGCWACIEGLSESLQYNCPNAIGAQLNWVSYCYLRYEAYPF